MSGHIPPWGMRMRSPGEEKFTRNFTRFRVASRSARVKACKATSPAKGETP